MQIVVYQYPPELFNLLVQTIPRLCRSKRDLLTFFAGAGVAEKHLRGLRKIIETDKDSITKFEMVRRILEPLNAEGDQGLAARREILKRVVEFEDFSTCWPNDQLEARGLVGEIRRVIDVKDSFTRMNIEREEERKQRQREHQQQVAQLQKAKAARAEVRDQFFALFGEQDPHKRGRALETVLNRLFKVEDIHVRDAFTLTGDEGEGIVEQIDGVIELDGQLYLVEMKWWNKPLGRGEVSEHLVRLYGRSEARGIFISNSGYSEPAVTVCKEALQQKVVVLCTLEEIVHLLESEERLKDLLKAKVHAAITEKNPMHSRLATS